MANMGGMGGMGGLPPNLQNMARNVNPAMLNNLMNQFGAMNTGPSSSASPSLPPKLGEVYKV
jgi:hypothetical protein